MVQLKGEEYEAITLHVETLRRVSLKWSYWNIRPKYVMFFSKLLLYTTRISIKIEDWLQTVSYYYCRNL